MSIATDVLALERERKRVLADFKAGKLKSRDAIRQIKVLEERIQRARRRARR